MSTALQLIRTREASLERPIRGLPVPWRDPHTVSPRDLQEYICSLEKACLEHPESADLKTCLGIAHAMNYDAYKSLDVLEAAVALDDKHFFAQLKYAELFYRLRALERAEKEMLTALGLAGNWWELSMARKLLQDIRQRRTEGTQKPTFDKPLKTPAFALMGLLAAMSLAMVLFK